MSGQITTGPPRVDRLSPRQQMAIDCAHCSRRLFRLWICTPECPLPVTGR